MSAEEEKTSPPKRRRAVWVLSALVIIFVAALVGLPYLIKHQAIKWLEANGADSAQIDDIDLNLFAGTFQVDNLIVQRANATPLRVRQLAGNLAWLELFNKRIVVESAWLFGSFLSVESGEDDVFTIGGINLPTAAPAPQPEQESASNEPSAWTFGVNTFVLADSTVKYRDPHLDEELYANVIYVLDMHGWEPERAADVGVDVRINGRPFEVSSRVRAFADDPNTATQLELQALDLSDFATLAKLGDVDGLSGTLSLKLALNAVHEERERPRLNVQGDLILRDLQASYGDMTLSQGLFHYTGEAKVHLKGPLDQPMMEVEGQWSSKDSAFSQGDLRIKHAEIAWRTKTEIFNPETDGASPRVHSQGGGTIDGLVVDDAKQELLVADLRHVDVKAVDFKLGERASVEEVVLSSVTALQAHDTKNATLPEIELNQARAAQIDYDFSKKSLAVAEVTLSGAGARDKAQGLLLADARTIAVKDVNVTLDKDVSVASVEVVNFKGNVASDGKAASKAASPPEIEFDRAQVVRIGYDFAQKAVSIGELSLADVGARDNAKKLLLASARKIGVTKVDVTLEKEAKVTRIDVADLRAVQPIATSKKEAPPVVSVGETRLQTLAFAFAAPRLEVDSVEIAKLEANLARDGEGRLYGLAQLMPPEQSETADKGDGKANVERAAAESAQSPALSVRLGTLKIASDAKIHWRDQFVKPAADVTVTPLALTLGSFDTAQPRMKTAVDLAASVHKTNEIRFSGHISPLDPKPNSQLDGTVRSLDLTDFSSYAAAAGYTLRSGRLDADITAKVTEGELDMLNKLVMTKLRLEGGSGAATRDAASGATALPLNVALGYLRDSNDQIKLDIPVTGNIRDPQFNFNDVIRLATQAAAQEAAMTYVTQALQPLGTVLLVGKLAKKAANALELQAIEFTPGESALTDNGQAYAEKLAALLNNRPGVKLTACGSATESDRVALQAKREEEQNDKKDTKADAGDAAAQLQVSDDELLKLAAQRGHNVRDRLVEKYNVNPDQLFDCRPALEANPDAVPSVTLGL